MIAWIGSILLIIGTCIGAATLAIPLSAGSLGFIPTAITLIVMWLIMTITGLMVLDTASRRPTFNNSFNSMAKHTLGKPGQIIAWLCCLLLLYALTGAYISGDASLITLASMYFFHQSLPQSMNALLFVLVLGGTVWWSTRAVDILNRGLMSIKFIALFAMISLLFPRIHLHYLSNTPVYNHRQLWLVFPVLITAFGYHTVIPTLCNYLGEKKHQLKSAVVLGTLIPLIIYLLWLSGTVGLIPHEGKMSFNHITNANNHLNQLINTLNALSHNKTLQWSITTFSNVAVTTSFLGVTIGLFDFIADTFKRSNNRLGRLQTALITFVPPVLFAWIYPNGFILALGFAGIMVTVLEVILPAAMIIRERQLSKDQRIGYQKLAYITLFIGFGLLGLELLLKF